MQIYIHLTFTTLWAVSAEDNMIICLYLFFLENRIQYLMGQFA